MKISLCFYFSVSGSMALSLKLLSECTPSVKRNGLVLLMTTAYLASIGLMAGKNVHPTNIINVDVCEDMCMFVTLLRKNY